jgi:CRP/FNR family transcriptional regulator, anaerobic regulatory protein
MKDFSAIKQSLLSLYPFSESQLTLFMEKLVHKKVMKNELLLERGQVSEGLTYIAEGSFRVYREIEETEITLNFFIEHSWVADLESLLMQQPSENFIIASEHSSIAQILLKDIHDLMDIHPCFRMLNTLLAGITISTTHLTDINNKRPDERYKELLLKHPGWIQRFPQKQIASYLGMTPETLSRVRARMV